MVLVVLPPPPFWLHMARTLAGPCLVSLRGSGNFGVRRPVGPTPRAAPAAALAGITPGCGSCRGGAGTSLGAALAAAARAVAFFGRGAAFLAGARVPLPATVKVSSDPALRAPFVDKTTCLHSDEPCSRSNDESRNSRVAAARGSTRADQLGTISGVSGDRSVRSCGHLPTPCGRGCGRNRQRARGWAVAY